MKRLQLITQYSLWYSLLFIILAAIFSFLLYSKKYSWTKKNNFFLACLRFVLLFFLLFLLIGPLIKHVKNSFEKPSVVIAIDNSQSVQYSSNPNQLKNLIKEIKDLVAKLEKEGATAEIRLLNGSIDKSALDTLKFNLSATNLSLLLKDIQSDYANRNLASVVLLSDGVYNLGSSPAHEKFSFPIYTVGLGDTVPKKDVSIKNLLFNKVSHTGNKFPIIAEIHQHGYNHQKLLISLKQNGQVLQSKNITLAGDKKILELEFQVISEKNGLQHYVVEIEPLEDEFTKENNISHAYVDIIEGKEKFLLIAAAPHPDIKAIKSALEKKENYELQVYIPGTGELKDGKFDLVIFHQIPDKYNSAPDYLKRFQKEGVPLFFITGSQTNISVFNIENGVVKITAIAGQTDQVTPLFNKNFEKFKFEFEDQNMLASYPSLIVPFGNYAPAANADVVLFQKTGSIATQKPLLSISGQDKKVAVFNGEGLWQWPLFEYNKKGTTATFEKLINNLFQYLSSKVDKRKFRMRPLTNEFYSSQPVTFETEIYNDIYEKIYGQTISLKIQNEEGAVFSYSFVNAETVPWFEAKGLPQGVYKYSASVILSGKKEMCFGEFSVKEINLELLNTTADHEALRLVSEQSGGSFFLPGQLKSSEIINSGNRLKNIIHTYEEYEDFINLPLLFFLLIIIISTEWFVRKYKGAY